ncbi:endonuclease NucS domain-containing protein [Treponema phagedenis]|uniref:Uncharacterized protein n=1 Tax=Treponema phagedenis TaxID=162 RepID=A0A0B7GU93_TREPH|nr:endonuclease NucS domain-containing protein [Treponema phagedenis]NVP24682.1 DUF91 domain-containing protein [Treponema phagedenis]QEJ95700.1 DUF91 domain-containing protein [Treponema phagedenis]QKS92917.1 DUF91 domain-containing protein [Treponema phagedenis]QLC58877.1 DUF91 domain-containing protein [Treponema phagedenis]CEM62043.1 hypothetical protein TPHV1_260032 [Treponema phagedenis]
MKLYSHFSANGIKLEPMPFNKELFMEAYLIENPEVLALNEDDKSFIGLIGAEVQVGVGRIDMMAAYPENTYAIIELKNRMLKEDDVAQLSQYFEKTEEIKNIINEYETNGNNAQGRNFIGILAGPDIDVNLQQRIINGEIKIQGNIPLIAITLKRYKSERGEVFILTEQYKPQNMVQRNTEPYTFNGQTYSKRRLVHAVVKDYLAKHKKISYTELEEAFPKRIRGSYGVFDTLENANKIFQRANRARHLLNEEDILCVGNIKIAVCGEWEKNNFAEFLNCARALGYTIAVANNE